MKDEISFISDNSHKPRVIILLVISMILCSLLFEGGFIYASLIFVLLFLYAKQLFSRKHNKGIQLLNQGSFGEARAVFQDNYDTIKKSSLISKYTLLDIFYSNKNVCKEASLVMIAYSYYLEKNVKPLTEVCNQVLAEFPKGKHQKSIKQMLNIEYT